MDMEAIGEFLKRTGLSPRALRLYDELGLLRPAFVDRETGYRFYTSDQSKPAGVIRLLRALDMPLRQVTVVLEGLDRGDRDASHRELERYWAELRSRLDANQAIVALAHDLIDQEGGPVIVSAYEEWKDRFCQHWDAEAAGPGSPVLGGRPTSPWGQPLVVWRAFTGLEGEPLDVRIRWFAGEGDAERLHTEVAKVLRMLRRTPNGLPSGPGEDRGAVFVQVFFDDSWRSRITHGPCGHRRRCRACRRALWDPRSGAAHRRAT